MTIKELIHAETKSIISVVGPTCTGKTGLSIQLAQDLGAEIVNADSRLVFEGMDIGTAKPPLEERAGIKHHLIDIVQPSEIYSSGEYRKDFDKLLKQEFSLEPYKKGGAESKTKLIVTGGTGMYLRSALEDLDMPEVGSDFELRAKLEKEDLVELCDRLKEKDPEAYEYVDLNNIRRVARALEVIELSGKKFSEQRSKETKDRYKALWIGLNFKDREKLYDLINKRVHIMIEQGLVAEVEKLLEAYGPTKTILGTIGYREIHEHLKGDATLDEAIALIQKRTRNYAKRQMTWFKGNPRIHWFEL